MTDFLSIVTTALVTILVSLICLLAWRARAYLAARLNAQQLALLQQVVARVVLMAEQVSEDNAEKKRLALETAEVWLKQYGIEIDPDVLEAAVEAAVFDELKRFPVAVEETAVTAPIGSLHSRTDGGMNTWLYVKESGTGNTGWVGK